MAALASSFLLSTISRATHQGKRIHTMATSTLTFAPRQLFGGAITAEIPTSYLDASDVRQVPDTQEVHLSRDVNDISLILEILESVKEAEAATDLEAAVRFHFASLAHDNNATSSSITSIFALPQTTPSSTASVTRGGPAPAPLCLVGEQHIAKYGRANAPLDRVRVWIALWRLTPAADVDLVLSVNEPLTQEALGGAAGLREGSGTAKEVFKKAVESLQIREWGLFAQ